MVIGIDGNEANVIHAVGVSVYTRELLHYFQSHATEENQFRVFLRNKPNHELPLENDYFHYEIVSGKILWSQIFLPIRLFTKKNIDLFFAPAHYAPRFCPVPVVVTIHDLSFYYFPNEFTKKDLYQLTNWTSYSIKKAKKIIAVSKTTKKDIEHFFEITDSKINVIYNGFGKSEIDEYESDILEKNLLKKDAYILYVGTVQPRKNIQTLLTAFAEFHKRNPEYKLVLVGKKGWLYEPILRQAEELNLKNEIIFTGYLPDEDVINLYKNAFCFILPSYYEGFGLPILEAMSYNCPVITSQASSLPEIGGDACLYFDPESSFELLEKLIRLSENKTLVSELKTKGKKRIQEFSWDKCAGETLSLLNQTIQK